MRSNPSLQRLAIPKLTEYIPHFPTPRQAAFLLLENREAFYGGAAGGGKSDALLMAALQYVDEPGYAALLLRRTFADLALPEALMDRAGEWLSGTDAKWNGQHKTWVFPSSATVSFGYLEQERQKYRYQSSAFQFIGFDELTQFSESQYRYLFSRLRRLKAKHHIPLRMRSASNPGNMGHEWVKQRFLIEGPGVGRVFIPAKLDDNPYLDREEYVESLSELDPITLRQLLDGDWSARQAGGKFRREWFEIVDAVPVGLRTVRYWDMAATEPKPGKDPDWTVGCLMSQDDYGLYWIRDVRRMRGAPPDVEKLVKQTAALDGKSVEIYMEQEPGSSGVQSIDYYRRKVLNGYTFYGDKATGSKELRANPVSSQAFAGNVKLLRGAWIGNFLDEVDAFPNGAHDDQVDAMSGAFKMLNEPPTEVDFV